MHPKYIAQAILVMIMFYFIVKHMVYPMVIYLNKRDEEERQAKH